MEVWVWSPTKKKNKKKNKVAVEQEPRSAHGRAVKKKKINKVAVEQEPRSAHGRAVNKKLKQLITALFLYSSICAQKTLRDI